MANLVDQALDNIETWLLETGVKESRLSLLACANAQAVKRVRKGTGTVKSLKSLLDYIEAHPADKQ